MTNPAIEIRLFDLNAPETDYIELNRHINRIRLERLPDDPPIPVEETMQNLRSIPSFVNLLIWTVWNPEQNIITAAANALIYQTEENKHLVQFDITVLPDYRKQGIGRQLLAKIAEVTQQDNRRLLMTSTTDSIPAGDVFMTHIGAQKGLEAHTNQLCIEDLAPQVIANWMSTGQKNSAEFEMGFWDGAYPEELLEDIADLNDLTNQQPIDDLEIDDMHMTPEQIRQMETNLFARGNQRWTCYIVERSSGKFAGYTETVWNPNRPKFLRQDMTGVFPQFRNKGLGHWLKAAMLEKIIKEQPLVKFIRTGNADSNASMLKINTELGFKPYMAESIWQVELQTVLDYLQSNQA